MIENHFVLLCLLHASVLEMSRSMMKTNLSECMFANEIRCVMFEFIDHLESELKEDG